MKMRPGLFIVSIGRVLPVVAFLISLHALPAWTAWPAAVATYIDIIGPPGSGEFGTSVTVLPGGNIIVTDPYYDLGAIVDVGAVYLYDGATGALISTLTGSTAGDQIGSPGSVIVLGNGNYLVRSWNWDNGAQANAGAVTWGNPLTGVGGEVSAANSLVGSTADDHVGEWVVELTNDNYVVGSPYWDKGAVVDAGAATWGNGATGAAGVVSVTNSLVGSAAYDRVGDDIVPLTNGNYLVRSWNWNNGAEANVGAATWGDGMAGTAGAVSPANSLVGSTADDYVGDLVVALSNGNYLVGSPWWDNGAIADAGAVTWGNGTTGITGTLSAANSLVGNTTEDWLGSQGLTALGNGNYLVSSPNWDNGSAANVGAVTWGNGATGTSGVVSAANSLVGSTVGDSVGDNGVIELSNGNYVVSSPWWDNAAAADAGAVTWGDGTTGVGDAVSAANSLVGSAAGDEVGDLVIALTNSNYVVGSPYWDNGAEADVGAATWGNGVTGTAGVVSAANSLVGSAVDDQVGDNGVIALSNGNYVVSSPWWDNAVAADAGAATWGSGTTGTTGVVSVVNSLVGSTAGDKVGDLIVALTNGNYLVGSPYWDDNLVVNAGAATWGSGMTGMTGVVSATNSLLGGADQDNVASDIVPLTNGNYVVGSPNWSDGSAVHVGAATWGNGATGTVGAVSTTNSLVGATTGDDVGYGLEALSNGHYLVRSSYWDNGAAWDAGAVTWASGLTGVAGPITAENSVRGTAAGGGYTMVFAYDYAGHQIVVGRPKDNIVTLFRPYCRVFLPVVTKNG